MLDLDNIINSCGVRLYFAAEDGKGVNARMRGESLLKKELFL